MGRGGTTVLAEGWGPELFTHADNSRVSKAMTGVCVCLILSVCPHDKTKTAESTITKLDTGIVHHDASPINEY